MTKPKKPSPPKSASRGLGRGLSALMSDVAIPGFEEETAPEAEEKPTKKAPAKSPSKDRENKPERGITTISMDQLCRNPDQPRRHFDKVQLEELSASIKDKGVLQPILVRPLPKGVKVPVQELHNKAVYQIIAGERRWQAALNAGLDTMPVYIREITDLEALEIGIVENVHRADLNPMEEALAYKSLLTQFKRTQEDVANAVGKSRSYITNMLRLLNLPEQVQDFLARGKITTGHARAIIAAPDPAALAQEIVDKDLSVRAAEDWVRRIKAEGEDDALPKSAKSQKSADDRRLEARIMDATGFTVDIRHKSPGGQVRINYKDSEQLDELLRILMKSRH